MSKDKHTNFPAPRPVVMINDVSIEQMTYQGQPVVTFKMIADVHGIPINNVRQAFYRNRERFQEGHHYVRMSQDRAVILNDTSNGVEFSALAFTEKGYLLLVKPMGDDISWQVQERMVDEYFRLREAQRILTPTEMLLQMAQNAVEHERRVAALEARVGAIEEGHDTPPDALSIKAFANLHCVALTNRLASRLGRRCSGLSRLQGDPIGTVPDEAWGQVNTYKLPILQAAFQAEGLLGGAN